MGIYITQTEAESLHGTAVRCRIQGRVIKIAMIHVEEDIGIVYLLQDIKDGSAPSRDYNRHGFKFAWEWDEQVECVKLNDNEGKQNTMSDKLSISESLKLIDLDDDRYLLRKYGIIDDSEDVTEEGKKILWRLILASNIDEVVKKLKKLEARKKADKKVKKEDE